MIEFTKNELETILVWYEYFESDTKPDKNDIALKIKIDKYSAKQYNPNFGDTRLCKCGHIYERHFDTYEDMEPVGCKYCGCYKFIEIDYV